MLTRIVYHQVQDLYQNVPFLACKKTVLLTPTSSAAQQLWLGLSRTHGPQGNLFPQPAAHWVMGLIGDHDQETQGIKELGAYLYRLLSTLLPEAELADFELLMEQIQVSRELTADPTFALELLQQSWSEHRAYRWSASDIGRVSQAIIQFFYSPHWIDHHSLWPLAAEQMPATVEAIHWLGFPWFRPLQWDFILKTSSSLSIEHFIYIPALWLAGDHQAQGPAADWAQRELLLAAGTGENINKGAHNHQTSWYLAGQQDLPLLQSLEQRSTRAPLGRSLPSVLTLCTEFEQSITRVGTGNRTWEQLELWLKRFSLQLTKEQRVLLPQQLAELKNFVQAASDSCDLISDLTWSYLKWCLNQWWPAAWMQEEERGEVVLLDALPLASFDKTEQENPSQYVFDSSQMVKAKEEYQVFFGAKVSELTLQWKHWALDFWPHFWAKYFTEHSSVSVVDLATQSPYASREQSIPAAPIAAREQRSSFQPVYSPSQLELFDSCPQRYAQEYLLRNTLSRDEEPLPKSSLEGELLHLLAHQLHSLWKNCVASKVPWQSSEAVEIVQGLINDIRGRYSWLRSVDLKYWEQHCLLVAQQWPINWGKLWEQLPCALDSEDQIDEYWEHSVNSTHWGLRARIDFLRVCHLTKAFVLIDFKRSSSSIPSQKKIKEGQDFQLLSYLVVVREQYPTYSFVTGYWNLLKPMESLLLGNIEITEPKIHYWPSPQWQQAEQHFSLQLNELKQRLEAEQDFSPAPKDRKACSFCSLKFYCPEVLE